MLSGTLPEPCIPRMACYTGGARHMESTQEISLDQALNRQACEAFVENLMLPISAVLIYCSWQVTDGMWIAWRILCKCCVNEVMNPLRLADSTSQVGLLLGLKSSCQPACAPVYHQSLLLRGHAYCRQTFLQQSLSRGHIIVCVETDCSQS